MTAPVEHVPAADASFLTPGWQPSCSCGWTDERRVGGADTAVEIARGHAAAALGGSAADDEDKR